MASVAEVAEAAGLAKGTVYLYFPSKEEMLLALHERQVAQLLRRADASASTSPGPLDFDDDLRGHRASTSSACPATSRSPAAASALMDREIPTDTALAFKARVGAARSPRAGAGLERHFPALAAGDGVTLLLHSYGLIVGLWQLLHPNERFGARDAPAGAAHAQARLRARDRDARCARCGRRHGRVADSPKRKTR